MIAEIGHHSERADLESPTIVQKARRLQVNAGRGEEGGLDEDPVCGLADEARHFLRSRWNKTVVVGVAVRDDDAEKRGVITRGKAGDSRKPR